MANFALSSKSMILALLMLAVIIFPKALFCEATRLPHRGLLQSGGIVCPACVCCKDPRPSVRPTRTSCCACCHTPDSRQSDKGFKKTGW